MLVTLEQIQVNPTRLPGAK